MLELYSTVAVLCKAGRLRRRGAATNKKNRMKEIATKLAWGALAVVIGLIVYDKFVSGLLSKKA